jgi:hypothetical protein
MLLNAKDAKATARTRTKATGIRAGKTLLSDAERATSRWRNTEGFLAPLGGCDFIAI